MKFLLVYLLFFSISTLLTIAEDVGGEISEKGNFPVEEIADYEDEFEAKLSEDDSVGDATAGSASDKDLDSSEEEVEQDFRKDAKPFWNKIKKWGRKVIKKVKKIRIRKIIVKTGNSLERIGKAVAKAGNKVINHFRRRTVCYQPYGCFSNRSPWNLIWNVLPQPPSKVGTTFILYNRQNRRGVRMNALTARHSRHYFDRKTVFIVHGWKGDYESSTFIRQMKEKFLRIGDFNVFGVYWGKGAKRNYFQAAGNTRLVGAQIAYLVDQLNRYKGLSLNKVHFIGFSLGAQIVGFAGRRLNEKGKTIARITGLDPAAPIFAFRPRAARLDDTDAKFVDVIHTSYSKGVIGRCGDVDFYVNKGGFQPGCKASEASSCSHYRAVEVFLFSINRRCMYKSYKCSSYFRFRFGNCRSFKWTHLGYHVNINARGKYYLKTKRHSPYC